MSKLVDTVRTTPTMRDFARALLVVCPELSKEAAGVLWAQFAGETGDGTYAWNWNLGNMKWSSGCGLDYMALRGVWEGFKVGDEDHDGDIDDDDRAMLVARMVASGLWAVDPSTDHAKAVGAAKVSLLATPANMTTWFRAYPTLNAGMAAFVAAKRDPKSRYAPAWAFVEAGDCDGFARCIGKLGYYTASSDAYSRAMKAKWDKWMTSDAFERGREDATPTLPAIPIAEPGTILHTTPLPEIPERNTD